MEIRQFKADDAAEVSALVIRTLREVNSKDYPQEYIENTVRHMQPEDIIQRAGWTHFYVFCQDEQIVGCGAIGPYWDSKTESCLFTIFVRPDYRGKGIGRIIMETLEADPLFLKAERVEIPASITGTPFYLKIGYTFKGGVTEPDEDGLLHLEKYRKEKNNGNI